MTASRLRLYAGLQHAAHVLKKAADRELMRVAAVTTAQAAVMVVISGEARPTQKAVAQALGLNESAVTAMTKRLVALGYVGRDACPDDRRAKLLLLTEEGASALKRVEAPFSEINRRLDTALGPEGVGATADLLKKITVEFAG